MSNNTHNKNVLDVKSKVASFEAHNEVLRTNNSTERFSNTGVQSPASTTASGVFRKSNSRHLETGEDHEEVFQKQSTTQLATQIRRNRLQRARQTHPDPGSLMQRRLTAKERRKGSLQQHPTLQQNKQEQQQTEQRQQTAQRSDYPSPRHNSTHTSSPGKELKSPSSLSHSRSPARRAASDKVGVPSNLSKSPRVVEAAQHHINNHSSQQQQTRQYMHQHDLTVNPADHVGSRSNSPRSSRYANNYNPQQQHTSLDMHRQHDSIGVSASRVGSSSNYVGPNDANNRSLQQKHSSQGLHSSASIGGSGSHVENTSNNASSSVSRFHKLKMKGMDHAKLAQKRKEAAQKYHRKEDIRQDRSDTQHAPPSPMKVQQQQPSPRQQQPQLYQRPGPFPTQHQIHQIQDSPDQINNTDDDATLTSVARILDQEQDSSQSKEFIASKGRRQPSLTNKVGKPPRLWMSGEEKIEKAHVDSNPHHSQGIYPRPSSSSEYEPEINARRGTNPYSMKGGGDSQTPSPQQSQQQAFHNHQQYAPPASYHSSQSPHYASPQAGIMMSTQDQARSGELMRRSQGSFPSTNGNHLYQSSSARLEDDDKTFDYGVKDDDSQGSTTFQKQLLEADRKAREQSYLSEENADCLSQSDSGSRRDDRRKRAPTTPRKKKDDPMEQYRQSMDSPAMKTAAGVVGAATVGCCLVGPVGMLLGAAAFSIGVGVMQIPEEQRTNMANKAREHMAKVEEQAYSASEVLSNSCATTYKDSGIAEHIPAEMTKFCAASEDDVDNSNVISPEIKSEDSEAVRLDQVTGACGGGVGDTDLPRLKNQDPRKPISPNQSRNLRSKKVACLRHVRIIPVSQIHGLDPTAQPRAWLDVLASADTSNDEKTEAMEEILILAKDKQRARIFLEEGILDSIMWILSRYFEKLNRKPTDVWSNPDISFEERNAAKLAATCCVTLGKAHCAAIHTEGDLLLMSLYERGTVPEERQLAQMLYEVPHHTRVTKTNDPTMVDPSMEVFALRQLTLPQAEELAKSIKALADGR